MVILFFFASLILTSQVSASELASGICGPEASSAILKSDWKEKEKGHYCARAKCKFPDQDLERKKCFWSEGGNQVIVSTTDNTSSASKAKADFVVLNAEEPCIKYCVPVQKLNKLISSFERKECVECFKKRALLPFVEDINYPELGKTILKGQKCYFRCIDKPGPITLKRELRSECQTCLKEKFSYLQTKAGVCWEVDSGSKIYKVNRDFCYSKPGASMFTTYVAFQSLIEVFSGKKNCYEVDEETRGEVYKMTSTNEKCELEHVDNTNRSVIEKASTDRTVKEAKAGSTSQ